MAIFAGLGIMHQIFELPVHGYRTIDALIVCRISPRASEKQIERFLKIGEQQGI